MSLVEAFGEPDLDMCLCSYSQAPVVATRSVPRKESCISKLETQWPSSRIWNSDVRKMTRKGRHDDAGEGATNVHHPGEMATVLLFAGVTQFGKR